jgi:glycosyltransferase involved in cell wall biosynthesis
VLTSILKPVDDTRMFEKFGVSLGQTNKYDVNIIGFASKNIKKVENVHFYPIFDFKRTSLMRLLAPWKLFLLLFKVKPSVIVFNSPEILYVILLYKLISGCKIIYDIQENYFRNVYYNKNYIPLVRVLLAYSIRFKEWSGRWLIDRIIFAEEGYKIEMPRTAKRAVVVKNTYRELGIEKFENDELNPKNLHLKELDPGESDVVRLDPEELDDKRLNENELEPNTLGNKGLDSSNSRDQLLDKKGYDGKNLNNNGIDHGGLVDNEPIYKDISSEIEVIRNNQHGTTFLFSGTISDNYGIFTAIDFIDILHKYNPYNNLLIAGYCANERLYRKLMAHIEGKPYIQIVGGDRLIPHRDIIKYIREVDFGLICYNINPSTENCFPTKVYEYMANRLPIIIQNYPPWSSFCVKHNAGIELNFRRFDEKKLVNSLKEETFYREGIPDEIYWRGDEEKLLKLMEDIQS